MSQGQSIESALQKIAPSPIKKGHSLLGELEEQSEVLRRYPWTALAAMKGDPRVIRKLGETEKLLKDLKKALSR